MENITAIWTRRIGDKVQTLVEINKVWRLVSEEYHDAPFSHIAEVVIDRTWPVDPIIESIKE